MVIVILAVVGLCLGSFVNALVWRLHEQEKLEAEISELGKKKSGAKKAKALNARMKELSLSKGRSMCTHCGHRLSARDLIPVLSWLELRGRCRYCHKPIGRQYPIVEAATAASFIVSYVFWPTAFDTAGKVNFAAWLIMLTGFIALTIYDLRWMVLPNRIIYPLIVLAAALGIANAVIFGGGPEYVRDAVIGVAIGGGFFYIIFEVSKGKWIGGGDVKLGFLLGFLLASPAHAFLALFVASLIGTLVAVPGLITKKLSATSHIPFGPFLILATIILKLAGTAIVEWYRRQFLLL
jgi:prepilin signal peptidase PulO-like enzyme (type II secretory pathway)